MITIKDTSREFSDIEKYLMTIAPGIKTMKDVEDGEKIPVDGYLIFEDTKQDKGPVEILSIITPNKEVYSCQSETFKRSFFDIAALCGEHSYSVVKISGQTKSGRDYINCVLDVESYK